MPRRNIKKETAEAVISHHQPEHAFEGQQHPSESSGDTVIVDDDVIMHEDLENRHQFIQRSKGRQSLGDPAITAPPESQETVDSPGGLEILGRGVKELIQAVQNLRHLGVEDLVIPLPKIVVVGDQSTGKSSLIEGISEIKVPRRAGVCTRCPLEINLSESTKPEEPWTCKVSLYKKYTYEGSQGRSTKARIEGATRTRPLGPWTVQDPEDTPFATTFSKEELAALLEWAQIATLNPSSSYENYMPASPNFKNDASNQVKFSPNVVRIEIIGVDLPNLSFYDLPGVINVSDVAEEGYLVNLVKNLVKEYIKADNCINLLTLPMTDDPANSSASMILRQERAECRTVGVLTKPDRVQEVESVEQWVHIFNGDRFRLGHGYYVVKNNPDVSIDHSTARAQERQFFENYAPWNSTLKQYESRFGTAQLQAALSCELTAQIRASLPYFAQQVQRKLEQIEQSLKALPEPITGNLPLKILEHIIFFEGEIQKDFDGGVPGHSFQMEWHNVAEQFRKTLEDSRPLLSHSATPPAIRPTIEGQDTPTRTHTMSDAINLDSDDEDLPASANALPNRPSKKRSNDTTPQNTPLKRARMGDIPLHTPFKGSGKTSYSKTFSLTEVERILKEAHVGLPGQIDPKATERMICASVSVWAEPLKDFLESSVKMCETLISNRVTAAFSTWQQTLLQIRTQEICASFFDRITRQLQAIVDSIYKRELRRPMMLSKEALGTANEKALTMLIARRRDYRASRYLDEQDSTLERTPNRQSRAERLAKITDAQLGPDPYAQEVLAMSMVKGYYECAYSRFVDIVCQTISCELFDICRNEIAEELKENLGVRNEDAHDRCALLLAINPDQERARCQLLKEKATLDKAQKRLQTLAEKMPNLAEEDAA